MNTEKKEYFKIVTRESKPKSDCDLKFDFYDIHRLENNESKEILGTVEYEQDANYICDLMNNALQKENRPVLAMNTAKKEYFKVVTRRIKDASNCDTKFFCYEIIRLENNEPIAFLIKEFFAIYICDLMNNALQKENRPVLASEMTLRDYFVGQMVAGATAASTYRSADSLYEDADIIVKARDK